MAKKGKSKFIIYAEYIPFCMLYHFIRLLPLRTAYALAKKLFWLLFHLADKRHSIRAKQHLLHAGVAKTEEEAKELALKSYYSFAMLLVEIVKLDQCYDEHKVTTAGDPESIKRFWGDKNGEQLIIMTAHYGNWEVAGMNFTVKSGRPLWSLMRPFANPLIGELILKNRRSQEHTLIDKNGGVKEVLKVLKKGGSVAILADQHASTQEGVETVFFGHPCRTHTSPARLHLRTGVPLVPYLTRRCGDNFEFEGVFGKAIEYKPTGDEEKDIAEITQMFTTALEQLIAEQPEQWMWAHRRWLDINRDRKKRDKGNIKENTNE